MPDMPDMTDMPDKPDKPDMPSASLICRVCGYRLGERTESRCPECGSEFDRGDPTSFRVVLAHPAKLGEYDAEVTALSIQQELLDAGILSSLEASTRGVTGVLSRQIYRVFVDAADLEASAIVLSQVSERADRANWRCQGCGEEVPGGFDLCWNCGRVDESATGR